MNNRNIHDGNFGWYQKGAMKKIEDELTFRNQARAKLVYIALCSMSAKHMNTCEVRFYHSELVKYSSLCEKTVVSALKDLELLEVVQSFPRKRNKFGKYEKGRVLLLDCNKATRNETETDWKRSGNEMETNEKRTGNELETNPLPDSGIIKKEEREKKEENKKESKVLSDFPQWSQDLALDYLHYSAKEFLAVNKRIERDGIESVAVASAATIEKLHRIDGFTKQQIQFVLDYLKNASSDFFWKDNVQTPSSLRNNTKAGRKFEAIIDKIKSNVQKSSSSSNTFTL